MIVRHLRDFSAEDPVDLFVLIERGSLVQCNIADEHHHFRAIMLVREKDASERSVTGVLLTDKNIQSILEGQSPWHMTVDATDIEKILPKYYAKYSA